MKTILFYFTFLFFNSLALLAQDCGKVIITNSGKSEPGFIVSMNGVRLNNEYAQSISFKHLDETIYRVKVLQAGSATALSFTINSEPGYNSTYLLIKDNVGRYALVLQSKSLGLTEEEVVPVSTPPAAIVTAPVIAVPTKTEAPAVAYIAPVPMSDDVYKRKYNEVKSKTFDDEKMERLKDAFDKENFNTNQVIGLMKLFPFDDKRLEVAKFAYPNTIDQDEFYRTYDNLTFGGSKSNLKEWVNKNKGK